MKTAILLALGLATFAAVQPAEARRGSSSTTQDLVFVAPTEWKDGAGAPLSLCMLTETRSKFFINFSRSAVSYALATQRCETDAFYDFDATAMANARAEGWLAPNLPETPHLSPVQIAGGYWGWGLVGGLVLFGGLSKLSGFATGRRRRQALGKVDSFTERAAQVMGMAAAADGRIDKQEVVTICSVLERITGTSYPPDAVLDIIRNTGDGSISADLSPLSRDMTADHRELLVKAALMVVASDGDISSEESSFLSRLTAAMGLGQDQFNAIVDSTFGGKSAPAE